MGSHAKESDGAVMLGDKHTLFHIANHSIQKQGEEQVLSTLQHLRGRGYVLHQFRSIESVRR